MYAIGFTGTQEGMTAAQRSLFQFLVARLSMGEFHHGDCTGADEQAHDTVRGLLRHCRIVIHPPKNESKRAFCGGDVILPAKDYLDRNRDIVEAVHTLIAIPKGMSEELRSGTWATVRHARRCKVPVLIIWPDGSHATEENT